VLCRGLLKIIVGVLTTCHTQYTWDRSIYALQAEKCITTFTPHIIKEISENFLIHRCN